VQRTAHQCHLLFLFHFETYTQAYENRIKLAAEIVKATRAAVNDDFVVIFRLSMLDLVDGGSTWPEVIQLGQELEVQVVVVIVVVCAGGSQCSDPKYCSL
jgi:2,4-dienoyl-CoA reductase-like NADH-dependent reductase (Old Yellow Enzyme family)